MEQKRRNWDDWYELVERRYVDDLCIECLLALRDGVKPREYLARYDAAIRAHRPKKSERGRCGARTRAGGQCQAPAMTVGGRCRLHGGHLAARKVLYGLEIRLKLRPMILDMVTAVEERQRQEQREQRRREWAYPVDPRLWKRRKRRKAQAGRAKPTRTALVPPAVPQPIASV